MERDASQFSSKEIIINIEYKYCPNLTIIDTPGLIAPAPGRKNRALLVSPHTLLPHFILFLCVLYSCKLCLGDLML